MLANSGTLSNQTPKYLLLGEVLRPHGVRGELRVRLLTDYPERISKLQSIYLGRNPDNESGIKRYGVEHMRMHQEYGLLKLVGVDDRDQADLLREQYVMVAFKDAVPLEEGEVYLFQIIGMQAVDEEGQDIGIITEILETGANDVYIIHSPRYGEVLFPAISENIIKIDSQSRIVTLRIPEGLLFDGLTDE